MFVRKCLVTYLLNYSAIGYVPTSSLIHLVCCCLQKEVNTKFSKTSFPSLCCGSTLICRRLRLKGTRLSFPAHHSFFCFWGKPWCGSWSGRGYAVIWPVSVKLWTVALLGGNRLCFRGEALWGQKYVKSQNLLKVLDMGAVRFTGWN